MDVDSRDFVLQVASGDTDPVKSVASVNFCESSASLQIGKLTVHIPWSELAHWQAWLAARVEKEA